MWATALAKPAVKATLGVAGLAAAWYIGDQLQMLGELKAHAAVQEETLEVLSTQLEDLSTLYAEREARLARMESKFSTLITAAGEIQDACTDHPLPAAYLDQLRVGASLTSGGVPPDPSAADAGDPGP